MGGLAVGQGSVSGDKTHLNWMLSPPGAYLLEIRAPQDLRNTSTGCAGVLFEEVHKTPQPIDGRLNLMVTQRNRSDKIP